MAAQFACQFETTERFTPAHCADELACGCPRRPLTAAARLMAAKGEGAGLRQVERFRVRARRPAAALVQRHLDHLRRVQRMAVRHLRNLLTVGNGVVVRRPAGERCVRILSLA